MDSRSSWRWQKLVRGNFLLRKNFSLLPNRPIRRQARIPDLVEQRAIADVQHLRGALPVPVVGLQYLQDELTFQVADRIARDFLQRDAAVGWDVQVQAGVLACGLPAIGRPASCRAARDS